MTAVSDLTFSPESRPLGKSGLSVSPLAWGMWRFKGDDVNAARALVDAAFEAGITLFDTADIYGADTPAGFGSAEALLGRVFAESPSLRAKMVLASKGGIIIGVPYDSGAAYIADAIDASLKRLGVDHIDLWQVHRPDILTHPAELATALETAKQAGKIGAIGVSNFTIPQTTALMAHLDTPLATIQPELSALTLTPIEDGTLDLAMAHGLSVLAWSPLGGGRLVAPTNNRERAVAAALQTVADASSVSLSAAAMSWIMAHPAGAIPIIGTQTAARIADAADAFKVKWTRTSWYTVFVAARGEPLP
jgi:aryl-alcohol dehydrogenase-like predicted oxidoreductase